MRMEENRDLKGFKEAAPGGLPPLGSLECTCGALVDACTAVGTGSGVDDRNVSNGDGVRRASVHACSACDTICFFDCRHFNNLNAGFPLLSI